LGHATFVGSGPAESWGFAAGRKGRSYHDRMRDVLCGLRRHAVLDVAVAVLFVALDTVVTLVGWSWWPARPDGLAWVLLAAQGLTDLSLVARRRAPIAVVGIFTVFTLAVTLLISPLRALQPTNPGNIWAPLGAVVAAYAPVYLVDNRRRVIAAFAAIALLAIITARPWQPSAVVLIFGTLRIMFGPLVAIYVVTRRRLVRALTERAERAEREQQLLAEQARAEERARLAGEMHDVVTHRVSLMVLQAGALRVSAPDEPTRKAAEELRAAGCRALDELRDLVGILQTTSDRDQTPEEAHPSTAELAALAAESTTVGLQTELVEDGDPRLASPVVGRTVYRIVQEALTNAHKHAPGAGVRVRVRYGPAEVRLEVRNTPPTRPVDAGLIGTGSEVGLASLRRRVELVGGTLHAGPAPATSRPQRRPAARVQPVVRGRGRRRRTDGVRPPADDPRLRRRPRGRRRGPRWRGGGRGRPARPAGCRAHGPAHAGVDGLTAIERINQLSDPPAVVALTTFDADQYVLRALRAGAAGSWSSRPHQRT
jgi:signal transduction histidine kinase